MKKKIGDVTLSELNKSCKENRKCSHCPFYAFCGRFLESFDFNFNFDLEVDLGGDH